MALRNMTPHAIVIYADDGKVLTTYPKSGIEARLTTKEQRHLDTLADGTLVYEPQEFNGVTPKQPNLVEGERGVIVSMPVGEFLRKKKWAAWGEVYCADTGPKGVMRAEDGSILGVRRLVRYV